MSAPWSNSALAASASLPGSNQVFDPDDLHLEVGIDRLRAEHEGVDAHHHFRDREGGDVAGDAASSTFSPAIWPMHVAAFIEARIVGRDVVGAS